MQPLVSIVTINKNDQHGLSKTIASIRGQACNLEDLELIIIDGNSNDGSQQVVRQNKDIVSVFVSESDSGIYDAMNKGIARSSGSFILFLNSGDFLFSEFNLIDSLARAKHKGYDILHLRTMQRFGKDVYIRPGLKSFLGEKSRLMPKYGHQGVFVSRRIYSSTYYKVDIGYHADMVWLSECRDQCDDKDMYYSKSICSVHVLGGVSNTPKLWTAARYWPTIRKHGVLKYAFKVLLRALLGDRLMYRILYYAKYDHVRIR